MVDWMNTLGPMLVQVLLGYLVPVWGEVVAVLGLASLLNPFGLENLWPGKSATNGIMQSIEKQITAEYQCFVNSQCTKDLAEAKQKITTNPVFTKLTASQQKTSLQHLAGYGKSYTPEASEQVVNCLAADIKTLNYCKLPIYTDAFSSFYNANISNFKNQNYSNINSQITNLWTLQVTTLKPWFYWCLILSLLGFLVCVY